MLRYCDTNTIQLRRSGNLHTGQWHRRHFIQNRNSDGNLYVRYLYFNEGHWQADNNWLDNNWNSNNPAARLATLFFSLPNRESFVL